MRLQTSQNDIEKINVKKFADWLLQVGEGKLGNSQDGIAEIEIPESILITEDIDPLQSIVKYTYPDLLQHLLDSSYLIERVILSPTMAIVDEINSHILSLIPQESTTYLSSDTICKTDSENAEIEELYDTEFLNTNASGIPPHKLDLKVGVPIMLIRNIDQTTLLCNGTRLRVTLLGKHFIRAIALNGTSIEDQVLIHRMDMNPSDSKLPFKMNRRQFPMILSFAMTINKSQGQS